MHAGSYTQRQSNSLIKLLQNKLLGCAMQLPSHRPCSCRRRQPSLFVKPVATSVIEVEATQLYWLLEPVWLFIFVKQASNVELGLMTVISLSMLGQCAQCEPLLYKGRHVGVGIVSACCILQVMALWGLIMKACRLSNLLAWNTWEYMMCSLQEVTPLCKCAGRWTSCCPRRHPFCPGGLSCSWT